jgi:hypothetical protein
MDMLDVAALSGLEWVYDKVEDRYGRLAAWLVTILIAFSILAAMVTVGMAFFRWLYS